MIFDAFHPENLLEIHKNEPYPFDILPHIACFPCMSPCINRGTNELRGVSHRYFMKKACFDAFSKKKLKKLCVLSCMDSYDVF